MFEMIFKTSLCRPHQQLCTSATCSWPQWPWWRRQQLYNQIECCVSPLMLDSFKSPWQRCSQVSFEWTKDPFLPRSRWVPDQLYFIKKYPFSRPLVISTIFSTWRFSTTKSGSSDSRSFCSTQPPDARSRNLVFRKVSIYPNLHGEVVEKAFPSCRPLQEVVHSALESIFHAFFVVFRIPWGVLQLRDGVGRRP